MHKRRPLAVVLDHGARPRLRRRDRGLACSHERRRHQRGADHTDRRKSPCLVPHSPPPERFRHADPLRNASGRRRCLFPRVRRWCHRPSPAKGNALRRRERCCARNLHARRVRQTSDVRRLWASMPRRSRREGPTTSLRWGPPRNGSADAETNSLLERQLANLGVGHALQRLVHAVAALGLVRDLAARRQALELARLDLAGDQRLRTADPSP